MKTLRIGVSPKPAYEALRTTFDAVGSLASVEFVSRASGDTAGLDSMILLKGDRKTALEVARNGIPCYAVLKSGEGCPAIDISHISFGTWMDFLGVLRGRTLRNREALSVQPVICEAGDECVATAAGFPIWTRKLLDGGGAAHFVALAPPGLVEPTYLYDHFTPNRFLRLLLLLAFLRTLNNPERWQPAPLRACFVIDDPNLSSPSYGHIRYSELLRFAASHNFHVSIAMIPLDAKRTCDTTAALFRDNPGRLSISVHGNNHTWLELSTERSDSHWERLLAQALRRSSDLETAHRVKVCRVMEPPYGTVNPKLARRLSRVGFEGLLVTPDQYLPANLDVPHASTFGMEAADCFPDGTAMIVRRLFNRDSSTDAILASFLGQPMVFAAHHQDAADGMSRMDELARLINSFGPVQWLPLSGIVRSNYQTSRSGGATVVRAAARPIVFPCPDTKELVIERHWLDESMEEELLIRRLESTAGKLSGIRKKNTNRTPRKGPAT